MPETLKNNLELELQHSGSLCVVGMDEAGMGPLAGPVIVGAACLPLDFDLPYLNDSKKLTAKRRANLEIGIKIQARFWSVGVASAEEINTMGIRPATFLAYARALGQISEADYLLIDAWTLPGTILPQQGVVRGDSKIASIAAASILAKEERDRMMGALHNDFPLYGFNRHKGYGTRTHLEAIRQHGPCKEHRVNWSVFDRL